MTRFRDRRSIISGILLMLALIACDSRDALDSRDTQTLTGPKLTTQTPGVLRNIPISNLSVEVTVDNVTKTYQGTDFPDGQWLIEFDLQPGQTYDIVVQWFSLTHLVLEETGQIFADPEQLTMTPDLEFISAGYDRFDDDCDGLSNLDEIRSGTDPNVATGTTESACSDISEGIVLTENVYPWVLRQHSLFRSEDIALPITRYEQSIQVTESNPNIDANFGMSLHTERSTGVDVLARVDLRFNSSRGKEIKFEISPADVSQTLTAGTAECAEQNSNGFACTIPYEWQEQQWYSVSIEQQSESSWKAMVREDPSGAWQEIATIESAPNIEWYRAQNVISYRLQIPSEQCRLGLAPLSMQYKQGVANNVSVLNTTQIVSSNCVKAGGGWSEGIRTIDNELVYSLTLGKSE